MIDLNFTQFPELKTERLLLRKLGQLFGFGVLDLHRIEALLSPGNVPSVHNL